MSEFILEQNKTRTDISDIQKQQSLFRQVICHQTLKFFTLLLAFAIIVPFLIYFFMFDQTLPLETYSDTCAVNKTFRIQCGNTQATEKYCNKINCCFDNATKTCYHYLPSRYHYYYDEKGKAYLASLPVSPFNSESVEEVFISINEIDETKLKIVLSTSKVPETPIVDKKQYGHTLYNDRLAVEVIRDTGENILSTAKGPLIVSKQYLEWSFDLNGEYLFGLGETLIELDENSTLTKVIYNNEMDHNTLPSFLTYQNGKFHGLIVRHTGPLEVTVLPSNMVSLKSLTTSPIELELTVGPKFQDVLNQQRTLTFDIPPWALGSHFCRGGTGTNLAELLNGYENSALTMTYESNCIHENLFLAMLINTDQIQTDRLRDKIKDLSSQSQFVFSLPPVIPIESSIYQRTKDLEIYYKNNKNNEYVGQYLGKKVVYPNYEHSSSTNFVEILLEEIQSILEVPISNIIFTNNWPREDSYQINSENFPYFSDDLKEAMSKTLPWDSIGNSQHFMVHNDYGTNQVQEIEKQILAPPTGTNFLVTASHNLNINRPILIQKVDFTWSNFRTIMKRILFSSIFVNPFVGAPACGSASTSDILLDESLCIRWYFMASTTPLIRISQELPSQFGRDAAKYALEVRKLLQLHYLTTIADNIPWMRPMFYDFENDVSTYSLYSQYLIGNRILVAHPVLPSAHRLWIYLPTSIKIWYEIWGGVSYNVPDGRVLFDFVETDWIGFIPEGTIIPLIKQADPTTSVTFIIGLKCEATDPKCTTNGKLKIESSMLNLIATKDQLQIDGIDNTAKENMGCTNGKKWIVQEIRCYVPEAPRLLKSDIDLCTQNIISF